jgi:nucleotide-binding universal stress UspA family protein
MEIDERIKEDVAKARTMELEEAEKVVHEARMDLSKRFKNVHAIAKGGDPTLEILHEAEMLRPDLIALGSRGLKGFRGMLGSVSRRILGHAQCPVLIGKATED